MPLIKSKSDKAFGKNIAAEIKAGKPPKQAAAIAYSVQRAAPQKEGGVIKSLKKAGFYDEGKSKSERLKIVSNTTTKPQRLEMVDKVFSAKKMKEGGLWDNIHAKRKRIEAGSGERMRKPGSEGAPTKQNFIESAKTAQKKEGGKIGLWDNIHAKRKRIEEGSGERMRKPGSKGAPTANDFKTAAGKMAKGGAPRLSVSRGEKLSTSQGAGLTQKGRDKVNRATGSNLKAPAPHPKTEADKGRKASFCARMSGMKGPAKDEKGRPTRKAASFKRWNCPGW